jgi:hypothetical protein
MTLCSSKRARISEQRLSHADCGIASDQCLVRLRSARSIPIMVGRSGERPPVTVAFRRSARRWLLVVLLSGGPGLIFLSGVVTPTTHGWEKIASAAVVLAFVMLGIRIARLGIFAGRDQLVVRNYFRSYRIGWPEISAFEMPPPYGAVSKTGLRIHLVGGRVISAALYSRGPFDSGGAAGTVLEALEQLRLQRAQDCALQQADRIVAQGEQPR